MTTRVLPPSEWPRLAGTELEPLIDQMDPDQTEVVSVLDDDGRLVACWGLFRVYHVEGLWVHPDYRKRGKVGYRLIEAMWALCRRLGVKRVATGARTQDVRDMIDRLGGVPLPGEHFVIPLKD